MNDLLLSTQPSILIEISLLVIHGFLFNNQQQPLRVASTSRDITLRNYNFCFVRFVIAFYLFQLLFSHFQQMNRFTTSAPELRSLVGGFKLK